MIKKDSKIFLDKENFIVFRLTPWDSKVFGFNTLEILDIEYNNEDNLNLLLIKADEFFENKNIKLVYCRISTEDVFLKKCLINKNYILTELTYDIVNAEIQETDFISIFQKKIDVLLPTEEDFIQIKDIAKTVFKFGRFHEDPFIDNDKANMRYYNWIDDLKKQGKTFLVCKNKDISSGFISFLKEEDEVELILGGMKDKYRFNACFFWSSFLERLKEQGVSKVSTRISSSNIAILNLYIRLGFKIKKSWLGFHKHI